MTYDHESSFHRFNALKFIKKLKSIDYHWIVMTYCVAIEHKIYNFSSTYVNDLNQQVIKTSEITIERI